MGDADARTAEVERVCSRLRETSCAGCGLYWCGASFNCSTKGDALMLRRSLVGLVFVLAIGSLVVAEETRGTIVKIEDGSITIRTGGGFGRTKGKTEAKSEEKVFKIS